MLADLPISNNNYLGAMIFFLNVSHFISFQLNLQSNTLVWMSSLMCILRVEMSPSGKDGANPH